MFFCERCRIKRDWPESMFKSFGNCEICNKTAKCNDVPSSCLPMPKLKVKTSKLDIDSIT